MPETELVLAQTAEVLTAPKISAEQVAILKATVAPNTTNQELQLFLHVCRRTGLDPFAKQIYAVKRDGKMVIQTAIDGFRLIAERTGKYTGQIGPQWADKSLAWTDVWTKDEPPYVARVAVLRSDFTEPLWAVAKWSEYAVTGGQGFMWKKMPAHMLGKVAEALALRRAFPQELSGLYGEEEMAAPLVEAEKTDTLTTRVVGFKAILQAATDLDELERKWSGAQAFRFQIGQADDAMLGMLERVYEERRAAFSVATASENTANEAPNRPATAQTTGKTTMTIEERVAKLKGALKTATARAEVEATWEKAKKLRSELMPAQYDALREGLTLTYEARLTEVDE